MFGMNDVGRELYKPGLAGEDLAEQRRRRIDSYERNMRDLIKALQAAHVAVTLITPSIFDETSTMDSANSRGSTAWPWRNVPPGVPDGTGVRSAPRRFS